MFDSFLVDSILDSSNAFFCLLDSQGKILSINTRFTWLLSSKSRESLIGKNVAESVQGCSELTQFFQEYFPTTEDTAIHQQVVQSVHRNGEKPLWIKFDISRVHSSSNGICIFLAGTDVTNEILSKREAEQKAHERSSFVVRMGHELRTPLNTVLGYAHLLKGLNNLSSVAQEYVSTIITNENHLLHLLNDIMELSKHDTGQTVTVLSETNIKKLIHEISDSYMEQFENKYLTFSVNYKTSIPDALLTDPLKVTQVISNIIGNALKFTRKGGVTITISCDSLVTIDIEDTGIGIPPDESSHVFEVYSQTGSAKEHMTGSGIGLAVARIFARMLGGDVILVRSDIGKGSLFRFTFNATVLNTDKRVTPIVTDYASIKGISKPCKVLLVDDVDINLAMLEIFLAPAGFNVSIAANGNEAIEKFSSFKPDIVFMDLIMPEKDGFEATREIKALNSKVPVIALTASIVDSIKEQALAAGVNDFMNKPFVPERFFEIIAQHTGITYKM